MKTKTTNTARSADRAERALFYFSTAQKKGLQAAAKRLGISKAAVMRRGLDLVIAESARAKRVAK